MAYVFKTPDGGSHATVKRSARASRETVKIRDSFFLLPLSRCITAFVHWWSDGSGVCEEMQLDEIVMCVRESEIVLL